MDWEKVKGFCRRQTQAAKEKMNNAPHTMDPAFNAQVEAFVNLRNAAKTTEAKLTLLHDHLSAANSIVADLANTLGQGHTNDEILLYSRKLEMFRNESANRINGLTSTFQACCNELNKFVSEANQLEMLLEDRRDKVLEFDFFKNKVEDLRANPPSDTSRIPRNEGRMNEWKMKYDDITNRTTSFMNNSRVGAETALLHGAVAVCNEYGRYLEELARAARAVLISDGSAALQYAARQVVNMGNQAISKVQQNIPQNIPQQVVAQQYQSPTSQPPGVGYAQQDVQAPPPEPKTTRNKRDDPFAL